MAAAKAIAVELLQSLGHGDVIDLGGIETARGTEDKRGPALVTGTTGSHREDSLDGFSRLKDPTSDVQTRSARSRLESACFRSIGGLSKLRRCSRVDRR